MLFRLVFLNLYDVHVVKSFAIEIVLTYIPSLPKISIIIRSHSNQASNHYQRRTLPLPKYIKTYLSKWTTLRLLIPLLLQPAVLWATWRKALLSRAWWGSLSVDYWVRYYLFEEIQLNSTLDENLLWAYDTYDGTIGSKNIKRSISNIMFATK